MNGADLKCTVCGGGAANVAPDYEFVATQESVSWRCGEGHDHISGFRPMTGRVEHLFIEKTSDA